jgi:hypothetical protein
LTREKVTMERLFVFPHVVVELSEPLRVRIETVWHERGDQDMGLKWLMDHFTRESPI